MAALRAAAAHPVHAYLFVGPAGNGGLAAAHGFAAALLCPDGGCGVCPTCRRALAGTDPDLHVVRRSGAVAHRRRHARAGGAGRPPPAAGGPPGHRRDRRAPGRAAAPALLKTLEEPPGPTVFILLADDVTPELATVASRCVERPLPAGAPGRPWCSGWSGGACRTTWPPWWPTAAAETPDGPRSMVDDPDVAERAALWSSVPDRLDRLGRRGRRPGRPAAGRTTDRAVAPLRAAHASEIARLTDEAKELGQRGLPGRKEIVDHHTREERRWRTDALRAGLGVLARAYRDRAVAVEWRSGHGQRRFHARAAVQAVALITEATRALPRNPQESLLLQSLLVRLGTLAV